MDCCKGNLGSCSLLDLTLVFTVESIIEHVTIEAKLGLKNYLDVLKEF